MKMRIAAAVIAALGIAAAPFVAACSLPLPALDASLPSVGGGGIYIFETISLVGAEIPAQAGRAQEASA